MPVPANDPEFGIFEAGLIAIGSLRIALSIPSLVIAWGLYRVNGWDG